MVSLDTIEPALWQDLVQSSAQATVFHTIEWLRLWQSSFPRNRVFFITLSAGNSLAAGMPVVEITKLFFKSCYSLPRGCYGGPLVRNGVRIDLHELLDRFAGETKNYSGMVEIVDFSRLVDQSKKILAGFTARPASTRVLTLADRPEEIWEHELDGKVRNQIRQSQRQGVEVRPVETPADIDACWAMYRETDRRHHRPTTYDRRFYHILYETLAATGMLHWTIARLGRRLLANAIYLGFNDMVFHWNGASFQSAWEFRPNNGLMWEAIRWACRRGFRVFNFGASPPTAPGLDHFKEGFGGTLTRYNIFQKVSPLFKLVRTVRSA